MSVRYCVVSQATQLIGKFSPYFAAALAIAAGALAPITAQAQSGSEVYRRMSDLYSFAKSYQGTIVRVQKGKMANGKSATQTVTLKISFKAPNKYFVNTLTTMTVGGKSQSTDQSTVTDGKSLFMFSTVRKSFQRGQIKDENMLAKFFALLDPMNGFLLLPESTVNGHAAFALKPSLPLRGNSTEIESAKKTKVVLLIDKQNYQFLKMTVESAGVNLVQLVSDQTVNGPVPDSLFNWTPPAGYKEVKPNVKPAGGPSVPGKHTGPIVPAQPTSP